MHTPDIWQGWPIKNIPEQASHEYGAERRKLDRAKKTNKEQLKTLRILKKHEPDLVSGLTRICLTEDRVRFLLEEIYKDCNGYEVRQRHNFFSKGLMNGRKELDWRIPIPSPMIVMPRQPAPFTLEKFEILESLNKLNKKFLGSLADASFYAGDSPYIISAKKMKLKDVSSSQLLMGQFLFSAIVNGALLHKAWINSLLQGLGEDVLSDESSLWLDLTHTIGEGKFAVTLRRRWFPDPITSALLVKIISKSNFLSMHMTKAQITEPAFFLNRFYASIGIKAKNRPTSNQLISAAKTKLALSLPPYLIAYARSLNQSQSLPKTCWYRIKDGLVPIKQHENTPGTKNNSVKKDRNPQSLHHRQGNFPDQLKQLRTLHSFFSPYHHKTAPKVGIITKKIARFINEERLCGMLELLAQWSLVMMRNKRLTGKKIKPASMQTYLYAIAKDLVIYGMELKTDELSADDWTALFDKVKESSSSPQRLNYKSKRLREFNDFLVVKYNSPWIHIDLNNNGDIRNITANIISSIEYKAIKQTIQNDILCPQRNRDIQSLIVTLGFRCGLRRKEALKIEMNDVQTKAYKAGQLIISIRPEIFIRNNRHGTVKSHKSTRRLPLHILLTNKELEELNMWVETRQQELGNKDMAGALLFCNLGMDMKLLSMHETFEPIQQAIRHITRDSTFTYHNLRHSFINILLLNLVQDDLQETLLDTWNEIKERKEAFTQIKAIRNAILLSPSIEPSRRFLYAVSLLCGHVDPKETLLSYLHVLDWILGSFLIKPKTVISKEVQANLLGVSRNSLKVIKSKNGLKGASTAQEILQLLIKRTKNLPKAQHEGMVAQEDILQKQSVETNHYENIALLLYQIFEAITTGTEKYAISEQYRVPEDEMLAWEATARKLAKIRTKSKALRLLTKPRHYGKSQPKNSINRFYPNKPHVQEDRQDAVNICDNIITLAKQNSEFTVNGLQLYISKVNAKQPDIDYFNEDEAKLFKSFLCAAGITKDRIMITLSVINTAKKAKIDRSLEYWSQLLGLAKENFKIKKSTYKIKMYPHGKTSVWVTDLYKTKRIRPKNKHEKQTRKWHTASGLRFALFMAATYLGVMPDNSEHE